MMLLCRLIGVVLIAHAQSAQAQNHYSIPFELSDRNTEVRFEVDSTWHLVEGSVKNIHGRAWLADAQQLDSLRAEIFFPVSAFDTGNKRRDKTMREVLGADRFPEVKLEIKSAANVCPAATLVDLPPCHCSLEAVLTIRGAEHPAKVPCTIAQEANGFLVSGEYSFSWKDFGVEDPSMLVAKLDETVKVIYRVNLAAQ